MKYLSITLLLFIGINLQSAAQLKNKPESSKLNTQVNFGTNFSSFGNGLSSFGTFVNPNLSYQFAPKLILTTGVTVMSYQFTGNSDLNLSEKRNIDTYFYAQAEYLASEKLRISGEVVYTQNNFSPLYDGAQSKFKPVSYSFSAQYKILPNLEIGIQFRQQDRNTWNPYNPYSNPYNSFGQF